MDATHKNRINRVVDHIQANLDADLSIKTLAKIACFSEFHFNRTFRSVMGETVYRFIKRLRLEKAAGLLLINPSKPITEIALTCGFETPSSFAKSFKQYFRMNATEWRNRSALSFNRQSNPVQIENGKLSLSNGSPVWTFQKDDSIRQVVIENVPPMKVAYVRNIGAYQGNDALFNELYNTLFQWAGPRGFLKEGMYTLNIYHDNPEITDDEKLRVMVAVPVDGTAEPSGQTGVITLPGGKYGTCRFLLKKDEFGEAWDWMYSIWLPDSGYESDDRETFERCFSEKTISGIRYFEVDICIPVTQK